MAEGFLKHYRPDWEIYSAGTEPGTRVNPLAVEVMLEKKIDISSQYPKLINKFIDKSFDYVITVCDDANEQCPVFTGKVKHRLHHGFEDPAKAVGSKEEQLKVYRRVRDEIFQYLKETFNLKI